MKIRGIKEQCSRAVVFVLVLMMAVPTGTFGQQADKNVFKQEELDQLLAPIALYPDSLLTQILMASTYPLEVVQADRWAKQNKDKKGDALAKTLEAQPWDPSVKSLVNFPQILQMMSEKLDMTQKLGDAFLAQQKDVMSTIQKLRAKAQAEGNLKTTKEQVVKVEQETIIIESASPQVIYVPAYNPTVVYGAWAYPAYPPYPYYPPPPPGYSAGAAFVTGVAVGAAWGYAWGHSDWHGGEVNVNVNQNTNINNNINRGKYANQYQGQGQGGQGQWKHDASHRGGVAYRDQGTAQKYNRGTGGEAAQSREASRGRTEQGRQDLSKGGLEQSKGGRDAGQRGGAYEGMDRGSSVSNASSRGEASRQSMSRSPSASSSSRGSSGAYSSGRAPSGGGGGGGRSGGGGGGSRGGRR